MITVEWFDEVEELVGIASRALSDLEFVRAHPGWLETTSSYTYSDFIRDRAQRVDLCLDRLEEALGVSVSCHAHVEVGVEDESRVTGRGVGQVDVAEYLDA